MNHSETLFEQAKQIIPGGVNSPVRAFNGVGGTPVFFKRGEGAYLVDVDDNHYIDYVGSWGPLILGHANPKVIKAVQQAAENGLGFGASVPVEIAMAKLITEAIPSIEMVRMVNSGTEATLTAIRLARGFTNRNKIIKFEGCYHGHHDALLVKAGSGCLTLGVPSSPGIPASVTQDTLTAQFNDLEEVQTLFEKYADDIAAVIVEPIAGNMGCIPAEKSFLQGLRQLCDKHRSVLIFDEVITGFRIHPFSAQQYYGVNADLTTLGKIIGGGQPVGAFGGSKAIMEHIAPLGPVYQAGTLSGNPIAMTAGLITLQQLRDDNPYSALEKLTQQLVNGLKERAQAANVPICINQIGSMFSIFFTEQTEINRFQQVMQCSSEQYKKFFHGMLDEGVYFAPSAFESAFISTAHSEADINKTLAAAEKVFTKYVYLP